MMPPRDEVPRRLAMRLLRGRLIFAVLLGGVIPPGLHRGMAEYFSKKRLPWIMRKACKSANMKNTCPYKSVKNALWQRTIGQVSPERAHLSTKALRECSPARFPWTGLFRVVKVVMFSLNYSLNQKSPSTLTIARVWRGAIRCGW